MLVTAEGFEGLQQHRQAFFPEATAFEAASIVGMLSGAVRPASIRAMPLTCSGSVAGQG